MGVSLCINNGTLITPHGALRCSVAIGEGKILALQTEEAVGLRGCAEVIDAKGKMVLPGVIDVHVHLEDVGSDGTPTADDFYDGTKSAAWGGTTCVIDFVTPDPGEGLTAALRRRRSAAERGSVVDFGFHMCITQNWRDEIDEVEEVLRSGVPSFKAFTTYQGLELRGGELFAVMKAVAAAGGMVMLHAEDPEILQYLTSELREDGKTEVRYHPLSRPDFAEEAAVLRAIALAKATGVPLYIAHVSSRAGADAIRKYRGFGRSGGMAHIYGETCPHYFWFTARRYEDENGRLFVMSPPLRSEDDVAGIWEALGEDVLDVVSTDHCPFRLKDKTKDIPFYEAPNGIGSIGLLLYTVYSRGRVEGENLKPLPINRIVELLSSRPARLFGLAHRKGAIMPGYDADLVIFDPTPEWIFRSSYLPGGEDHSVYDGFKLKGRVDLVVSRGEIVARDGEVLARPGRGRFVERFIPKETEQRS